MEANNSSKLRPADLRLEAFAGNTPTYNCENCKHSGGIIKRAFHCKTNEVIEVSLSYCKLIDEMVEVGETCELLDKAT